MVVNAAKASKLLESHVYNIDHSSLETFLETVESSEAIKMTNDGRENIFVLQNKTFVAAAIYQLIGRK